MDNGQKKSNDDTNKVFLHSNDSYATKVMLQQITLFNRKAKNNEITGAQALQNISIRVSETRNSMVIISAIMATESLVISNTGTNLSLVEPAAHIYENVLRKPTINSDVIEVTNDSMNNIIQNTNPRDVNVVRGYMSRAQQRLDQLMQENRGAITDVQSVVNSGNCTQTKYGVVNPEERVEPVEVMEVPVNSGNCAQTKYGVINPQTETRNGHVLFQTPNNDFIVAPKNRIPEKYFDKEGRFAENTVRETFSLTKEPQIVKDGTQKNGKDKTLQMSDVIGKQGYDK